MDKKNINLSWKYKNTLKTPRTVETPEGQKPVSEEPQDSYIGTNEAAVRMRGDEIESVNFLWNKGGGEGKDDIPAGGITDDNVGVVSAEYTKGREWAFALRSNYRKMQENLQDRRGTGNVSMNTERINNANLKAADDTIIDAMNQQKADHEAEMYLKACKGKNIPGFAPGKDPAGAWANSISSGLGLIGGLTQYLDASNQRLNSPNIYVSNPYESQALTTLAGLRDNPYQQLRGMQDVERRNRYAISQMGGLTGAQKYFANVASNIGMQRNYADILAKSNAQNNAYKAQWANAAMTAGQANAARMQAANQYRDEAYAKAHAARQQQKQMGMFNMLNQVQQFYANEFKRKQFNKMYDLYAADMEMRKKQLEGDEVYIPTLPQGILKELPGIKLSPDFKYRRR